MKYVPDGATMADAHLDPAPELEPMVTTMGTVVYMATPARASAEGTRDGQPGVMGD